MLAGLFAVLLGVLWAPTAESVAADDAACQAMDAAGEQDWGYVDVRPGAHMFWWLFETTHADGPEHRPLVMWLQGGPGGSSTGYGNLELIGPVDLDLTPRNTSWVREASVLFVDSPVGSGYSYVEANSTYTTDVEEIAADLLTFMLHFLKGHPKFKTVPFYIFGQSYGGKMAAVFAHKLYQSIQSGNVDCKLKGLAMGNSWISGVDSTVSWAPLLLEMGLVDETGYEAIHSKATLARERAAEGDWQGASDYWLQTEGAVTAHAARVSLYNLRKFRISSPERREEREAVGEFDVQLPSSEESAAVLNGPIKTYLGIIPEHVGWNAQSDIVFSQHKTDFMKPVYLTGAMRWVQRMQWSDLGDFTASSRLTLREPDTGRPEMFVKSHRKFDFYWILEGGHSIAQDQPEVTLRMFQRILADS